MLHIGELGFSRNGSHYTLLATRNAERVSPRKTDSIGKVQLPAMRGSSAPRRPPVLSASLKGTLEFSCDIYLVSLPVEYVR